MSANTDQDDIIAQSERLTTQLATARQTISTLQTDAQNLRVESGTLKTMVETLRAENSAFKGQLADARQGQISTQEILTACVKERDALKSENEALVSKQADFDKAVAAKVTQMGFAKEAASQDLPQTGATRNYTEECKAARGK